MIPHFNYPFRFAANHHVDVIEQDTVDDVVACIALAFLTEPGMRVEVPGFGVPSQVFDLQPLDLETIIQAVSEWESRVDMIVTQYPDTRDVLIAKVQVAASYRSVTNA